MSRLFQVVILAGGTSRRMGTDKAWMKVDGELVLPSLCERLGAVADGPVIVVRRDATQELPPLPRDVLVVEDMVPQGGPLVGIVSGMWLDRRPFTFACACDMPYIDPALVRWMRDWRDGPDDPEAGADLLLPVLDGRDQPLHAMYGTVLPPFMMSRLDQGIRALHAWPDEHTRIRRITEEEWRPIHPSGTSFQNVNTPADLPSVH